MRTPYRYLVGEEAEANLKKSWSVHVADYGRKHAWQVVQSGLETLPTCSPCTKETTKAYPANWQIASVIKVAPSAKTKTFCGGRFTVMPTPNTSAHMRNIYIYMHTKVEKGMSPPHHASVEALPSPCIHHVGHGRTAGRTRLHEPPH